MITSNINDSVVLDYSMTIRVRGRVVREKVVAGGDLRGGWVIGGGDARGGGDTQLGCGRVRGRVVGSFGG